MTDWIVRPYRQSDEGFVVFSWMTSYQFSAQNRKMASFFLPHLAHTFVGRRWGDGPDGERGVWSGLSKEDRAILKAAQWAWHRPVVTRLLGEVSVLCDPVEHDVILGWASFGGPHVLHYALCKQTLHDEGLAREAFSVLLGDRLSRPQRVSHQLVDMERAKIKQPLTWVTDSFATLGAA